MQAPAPWGAARTESENRTQAGVSSPEPSNTPGTTRRQRHPEQMRTRLGIGLCLALWLSGCKTSSPAGELDAVVTQEPDAGVGEVGTRPDAQVSGDAAAGSDASAAEPADAAPDSSVAMDATPPAMDAAPPSDAMSAMDSAPDVSNQLDTNPPGDATSDDDASSHDSSTPPAPVNCTGSMTLNAYVSDPKLCVYVYADGLAAARQMAFAPNGDLFVNNGAVTVLWDADHDGASQPNERAQFASAAGLNHGLAFSRDQKFVYASSATAVFRWAYVSGQRTAAAAAETVIAGIPSGGHTTRTLAFDSSGRLYVSVGSASNVDVTQQEWDTRAQIRRFTLPSSLPNGGLAYADGEVIARGMRNEVGLFIDANDHAWSVENGRDNLSDPDLGGDIHNDNPGEEINFIDGQGATFYGYPLCFSEYAAAGGMGPGTQWADQTLDPTLQKTDAFCRDTNSVHPPAWAMPAHWAPLGIIQYTGSSLPFAGDLLIAAHGSWNRQPAVGRVIARAHLEQGHVVSLTSIVGEKDSVGALQEGTWNVRPVDLRQGPDDAVYVSDDQGGRVLKIGYMR
jgi:glucose/arabinose dehydrogenase